MVPTETVDLHGTVVHLPTPPVREGDATVIRTPRLFHRLWGGVRKVLFLLFPSCIFTPPRLPVLMIEETLSLHGGIESAGIRAAGGGLR